MQIIPNYEPFEFQTHAIEKHVQMVHDNHGTCIFDETGLGKTIISSTVALNLECNRLLVISRSANKNNWNEVLSWTEMQFNVCTSAKIVDNEPDVVIVDEAHNFKNHTSKSYMTLFKLIKLYKPRVILLTATPFQNKAEELRTMVSLIHFKTNTPAFILLGHFFKDLAVHEKALTTLKRYKGNIEDPRFSIYDVNPLVDNTCKFEKQFKEIAQIFATFSHRNTRKQIETDYKSDSELMGRFPEKNVISIEYENTTFQKAFHNTLRLMDKLSFPMQNIANYQPDKPDRDKSSMSGIMKCFLLKRLDSSINAFKVSVDNMYQELRKINIKSIEKETGWEMPMEFRTDCDKDKIVLSEIMDEWVEQNDTEKVELAFQHLLQYPKGIIFTEYRASLDVLCQEAEKRGLRYIRIDGNSSDKLLDIVQSNFDANLSENTDTIDYLFTTDVLAESVNLHIAKMLIHFDQKWNPSRTAQRNGRIDRILKTGTHTHITIADFKTQYIVEKILELEKKIDHKQFMGEMFLQNLQPYQFSQVPEFKHGYYFYYPYEENKCYFIAIRTWAGDILIDERSLSSLVSNHTVVKYHKFKTKGLISKFPNKTHFRFGRDDVFQHLIEVENALYTKAYRLVFEELLKNPLITNLSHGIAEMKNVYKMENREPLEICTIWCKDTFYIGWENKFEDYEQHNTEEVQIGTDNI